MIRREDNPDMGVAGRTAGATSGSPEQGAGDSGEGSIPPAPTIHTAPSPEHIRRAFLEHLTITLDDLDKRLLREIENGPGIIELIDVSHHLTAARLSLGRYLRRKAEGGRREGS